MSNFDYSGYPTRDSVPRGYCFYRFVQNFRSSGGYGGLVPQRTAPIPPPVQPAAQSTQPAQESGALLAQQKCATIEKALTKDSTQKGGEFDATEGEAQAELKWRDHSPR